MFYTIFYTYLNKNRVKRLLLQKINILYISNYAKYYI